MQPRIFETTRRQLGETTPASCGLRFAGTPVMKRWLGVTIFMLGCLNGSSGPSDPAIDGACSGLDEADCAHTSGCHLEFSSDEPCDNVCCASHFDRCDEGASVNCAGHQGGGACNVSCAMTDSVCDGSLVQAFSDDGCCPAGCVAISQCAGVTSEPSTQCTSGREDTIQVEGSARDGCDPGDLSLLGTQGCPS
jgi:hypothetical protein